MSSCLLCRPSEVLSTLFNRRKFITRSTRVGLQHIGRDTQTVPRFVRDSSDLFEQSRKLQNIELIGDIFIAVLARKTNHAFSDRPADRSPAIAINHSGTGLASARCLGLYCYRQTYPWTLLCIFFLELVGVGLLQSWRLENNLLPPLLSTSWSFLLLVLSLIVFL